MCCKLYTATTNMWGFPKIVGFPPKSSTLIRFSIINHPFWGTPIYWKNPRTGTCFFPHNSTTGLLVGGWTNPIEKYARQIGSFAQVGVKIKKCLKPPSRLYHLEDRWRNSNVLAYHGPENESPPFGSGSPSTFTTVYVERVMFTSRFNEKQG